MKANRPRRGFSLCCMAAAALLMMGCDSESGGVTYEIIYPSGNTRDYTTYHKNIPVEGTDGYLQWCPMLFLCPWKRGAGEAVWAVEDTCPKRGDLLPGHVRLEGGTQGLHL